MRALRILAFGLFLLLGGLCRAQITADALPADVKWYLHADLDALRHADAGKPLYKWMQGEVFADIDDDVGIDLDREVNTVTAFADANLGTVVVVEGPVSQETRDKLLAVAMSKATLDQLSYGGHAYYHMSDTESPDTGNHSIDDLADSAYFSFDLEDKVIMTSSENQLKAMLDSGGRLPGNQGHPGALFVLTADRSFMQAGMRTDELAEDQDWDSNILRNTEQLAVLVSGQDNLLSVEAELVSRAPEMAKSLGSIANGLLSLQALSDDVDPEIREVLRNTRIKVDGKALSVSVVVDPNRIVERLDGHGAAGRSE